MPETVRETVAAVAELTEGSAGWVEKAGTTSVRQVADKLGLDISTASRRVKKALVGGYLENLETGRGRPYKLKLGAPVPDDVAILPEVRELEAQRPWQPDVQGFSPEKVGKDAHPCSVATRSGGEFDAT